MTRVTPPPSRQPLPNTALLAASAIETSAAAASLAAPLPGAAVTARKQQYHTRFDSSNSEKKRVVSKANDAVPPPPPPAFFHGPCSPKHKGGAATASPFTDTAKKYHEALANATLLRETTIISDATISRGCVHATLLRSQAEPPSVPAKRCDLASGSFATAYNAARAGAPADDELRAELQRFIAAPPVIRGVPATAARLPLVADALEAARCEEVAQLLALLRPASNASEETRPAPSPFSLPSVLREDDAGLPRMGARLRAQTTCGAPNSEGPLSSLLRALAADEGLDSNLRGGYHPRTSSVSLAELQLRASFHAEAPPVVLDAVEGSPRHGGAPDSFSHLTRLTEAAALPCSAQATPSFPCNPAPTSSSMAAGPRTSSTTAVAATATPGAAQLTLIVNVPPTTTRQDLLNAFKTFGQVLMPTVVCRKETRHPKKEWTATAGYAFVLFGTKSAAQAALAATEAGTVTIRGTPVKATWAKKDSFRTKATALAPGAFNTNSSADPPETHVASIPETHPYRTMTNSQYHRQASGTSLSPTSLYTFESRDASKATVQQNADHIVNDTAAEWYSRTLGGSGEASPFSTTMMPTALSDQQKQPFTSVHSTQPRNDYSFYHPPCSYASTQSYCDSDPSVGTHLCFGTKRVEPSFTSQSAPLLSGVFSEAATKAAFSSAASTTATTAMTTSPLSSASSACSLASARPQLGVTAPPPSPSRSDFFVNQQKPPRRRPAARSFSGTTTTTGSIAAPQPTVSASLPSVSAGCSLTPTGWRPSTVTSSPPHNDFFTQRQAQQQDHRKERPLSGSLLSMPPSSALRYSPPVAQEYTAPTSTPSPYATDRHQTPFFFVLGEGAGKEEQRQSLERQHFYSQSPSLFSLPVATRKQDDTSYGLRSSPTTDFSKVLMQQQAPRLPLAGVPLTTATPHHRLLHR